MITPLRALSKDAPETGQPGDSRTATELFRPEAVVYSQRRLQGDVVLAYPIGLRVYGVLIAVVIFAATVFASTATYSRKERVAGWVQPEGGLIRTSAFQAGLIEEILVREGDKVRAGEPIARLRLTHDIDDGHTGELLQQSQIEELRASREQIAVSQRTLLIKQQGLIDQKSRLTLEVAEARDRLAFANERLELSKIDEDRTKRLVADQAFAKSRLESSRTAVLNAETAASQAATTVMSLERQISDLGRQISGLPSEKAAIEAQASLAEAQMAQRATSTAAQSTYVVTAPISADVLAVPVERGQAVPGGGTIAVLAPAGSRLVADLYVPSRAAGFIKAGQDVRLMYEAFPHEKFGAGSGKIIRVSNTVLGPSETAIPGLELNEPVFRVRVGLEKQSIDAYGEAIPLQPGMLLNADLIIDRRSLLEWLLDPLYAAGDLR